MPRCWPEGTHGSFFHSLSNGISLVTGLGRLRRVAGLSRVIVYRVLGAFFFALGGVGIVVPLLPTVVFWIVAAFFFARSAPHLRDRIYAHRRFGPAVRDFVEYGAMSRRGKAWAVGGICGGVGLSLWLYAPPLHLALILVGCLLPVLAFLLSRPAPAVDQPPQKPRM